MDRQRHSRYAEGRGKPDQDCGAPFEGLPDLGHGLVVELRLQLTAILNQGRDPSRRSRHRVGPGSAGPALSELDGEVIPYGIEMGGDPDRVEVVRRMDLVEGVGDDSLRGPVIGDLPMEMGKLPGSREVELLGITCPDAAGAAGPLERAVPAVSGPQQRCMVGNQGSESLRGLAVEQGPGELGVELGPGDQWVDQTLHRTGQRSPIRSRQHRLGQPGRLPSPVQDDTARQAHRVCGHQWSPGGRYDQAMPELTPEAIEVRDLIVDVAGALDRRRAAWQPSLERARALAATITDPVSGPDARMRVANIDHLLALRDGDPTTAMSHLDSCLAIVDHLRAWHLEHGSDAAELTRLNDHEWGVRLNRCQVWQSLGDWDRAWADVESSLRLAEVSLEPAKHKAMSLVSASAIKLETDQFAEAIDLARQQVELARKDSPDTVGTALLSLAQTQARVGAYAEAVTTVDRAEPLLAGDVTAMASVHQLRGFLAMARHDLPGAEHHFAEYAEHTNDHAEVLEPHHLAEAAKGRAFLLHSQGRLREARREYQTEVERSRAAGQPIALASALCQLSGVTQDIALSRTTLRSTRMHEQALAEVDEAQQCAATAGRWHLAAGLDVLAAKYLAQFHETVTRRNVDAMTAGLERCLAATVFLHQSTFSVPTAQGRRAMADRHTSEAFDICFALAFRLGIKELVAELIELRCAAGQFHTDGSVPHDGGAADVVELDDLDGPDASTLGAMEIPASPATVLLAPPPPLLFSPGRIVLTEAFDHASLRYGAALHAVPGRDERAAVATW